eukprot:1431890-Rhodomonas_salina.1
MFLVVHPVPSVVDDQQGCVHGRAPREHRPTVALVPLNLGLYLPLRPRHRLPFNDPGPHRREYDEKREPDEQTEEKEHDRPRDLIEGTGGRHTFSGTFC